ncbi:hypothetical protein [Xenorhabdus sp. KJ12.1]|uniref:hypothetical protein n=1 Tax=Xenorhabdus sp. KJ12.1 TaxID=1851571 RepID=UPI000C050633|nr:hypothetical protein [Xenorhabdus sp. KJ12.1]PHM72232.1 hypothetical protein Xekj_00510 [Xenorhabdus sp. KJ12.1]
MGTYISTCVEIKKNDGWTLNTDNIFLSNEDNKQYVDNPFDWQSYSMYGFFVGIRNSSECVALSEPRGFPEDTSNEAMDIFAPLEVPDWYNYGHGSNYEPEKMSVIERLESTYRESYCYSWLSVAELLSFDYDQEFIDKCENPPKAKTYRRFLGNLYFEHLSILKSLGDPSKVRILFCFDG